MENDLRHGISLDLIVKSNKLLSYLINRYKSWKVSNSRHSKIKKLIIYLRLNKKIWMLNNIERADWWGYVNADGL
jgi:transposase